MVLHATYVSPLCLYFVILSAVGQDVVNVAIGKTYKQINKHPLQGPSSNAANNNTSGVYEGNNCIHTVYDQSDTNHWWEVDLGRTYPVQDITVWARFNFVGNFNNRLYPFTITVDNKTCVNVTSPPNIGRSNSVTCSSVMYGRVVRLTLTRTDRILNLCEFQIFVPSGVSQCPAGHHGAQCGQTCSNCGGGSGNNFCYQDTGVCYDDCKEGNYGANCGSTCDNRCAGGCAKVTGYCSRCVGNFAGYFCQDCRERFYGSDCTSQCHWACVGGCDRDTGLCTICAAGYWGETCETQCNQRCTNAGCYKNNGYCIGCDNGHWGNSVCDQPCPDNCAERNCQRADGYCYINKKDSLIIPVVGSVIGAAVIIAIAVVAVVCWFRCSRGELAAKHDTRGTITDSGSTDGDTATESSGQRPPSSSTPHNSTAYYEIPDTTNTLEMSEVQNNYDMLHPYSNDDADRQPYSQLTSHESDVTQTSGENARANTAFC